MSISPPSPAKQAREALGIRLRELRKDADLTGRALASLTGWHFTKISRMEHGGKTPTEEEIRIWCRICEAEGQIPDLIATVRAIDSMYLELRRQTRAGMKRLMQAPIPLYERTELFRIYEHNVIPGLFQTAGYARAMLSFWITFLDTPNDLEAAVTTRMERQRVIHQGGKRFVVVLEEQALRVWFGTAETQVDQLEHLLRVMSLPAVSVGIIPMMTERVCVASVGFWVFDSSLVALETPTASIEVTRPQEIELYIRMFDHLRTTAIYGNAARRLVARALEDLATTR